MMIKHHVLKYWINCKSLVTNISLKRILFIHIMNKKSQVTATSNHINQIWIIFLKTPSKFTDSPHFKIENFPKHNIHRQNKTLFKPAIKIITLIKWQNKEYNKKNSHYHNKNLFWHLRFNKNFQMHHNSIIQLIILIFKMVP